MISGEEREESKVRIETWRLAKHIARVEILKLGMLRFLGEHITDTYITETDTTELENLSHNIIDIFIIETYHN